VTAAPDKDRPLIVLSVASGYGGAERDIEIFARQVAGRRKVIVFAANPLHLAELGAITRPGLVVERLDLEAEDFVFTAARRFALRYAATNPSAVLANTLESLRILARAAAWLPGLDRRAFVFVRDYLWRDYEPLLDALPEATVLAPDRTVFERLGYIARHLVPEKPRRGVLLPSPAELPTETPVDADENALFLHLATVNGFKGHGRLIEAFARLRVDAPEIRGASYGHRPTPELFAALERQARRANVTEALAFHDYVADPSRLLDQCRAVVVASVSCNGGPETFGRTIIEAWAHARPVIAFAAGAPRHLIRHEVDGLLVPEGDSEALAQSIRRLHDDPALATRMGRAGRERAEREFAAERVVAQTLAVLDGAWLAPCARFDAAAPRAAPDRRVLFDVSLALSLGWRTPVGMSRIERDLAERLAAEHAATTLLVCGGGPEGGFRRLAPHELEMLAQQSSPIGRLAARELEEFPGERAASAPPLALWHRLLALHFAVLGKKTTGKRRLRRWLLKRARAAIGAPIATPPREFAPRDGDVLICVSNPWDRTEASAFARLKSAGVRIALVVHDLMVWETPHLTGGRDPVAYAANMLAAIEQASGVVAVSDATAQVLARAFAAERRAMPPVCVASPAIGLGAGSGSGSPPPGMTGRSNFALFCSTIEIRKNHILLLRIWDQLRSILPAEQLPELVFVGGWGWGIDAVRLTVERNWRLSPHLRILDNARDDELLWLYRHARFTLFPSRNEGFGLPIAESLSLGAPALVSDHPATVEASQGLMPALDPDDLPAWRDEILRLIRDDDALRDLKRRAALWRKPDPQALVGALMSLAELA
jgi:glycosyltransferase involved in cell wall biosynthesis